MGKRVFLCWLNDNDTKIEGYVELVEQSPTHVKFMRGYETITIPMIRVLKLKETAND